MRVSVAELLATAKTDNSPNINSRLDKFIQVHSCSGIL